MLKNFFALTKPGIIFGNAITLVGGFFVASHGQVDFVLLIVTLIGLSLVIASGCVFNNYIDQDIDKLMQRTKNRVLVKGLVKQNAAIIYAIVLAVIGFLLLYKYTNLLTIIISLVGFFVYVIVYSLWAKRNSIYGTVIGSISGAVPPLAGYCAVTNNIDSGAIILFLMLSLWQMPHSYAIALFRFNDYSTAKIPVLPVEKGFLFTKIAMLIYLFAFVIASLSLTWYGYTGIIYFYTAMITGIVWLCLSLYGFYTKDDKAWARKMFMLSVINITILSIVMSIDTI